MRRAAAIAIDEEMSDISAEADAANAAALAQPELTDENVLDDEDAEPEPGHVVAETHSEVTEAVASQVEKNQTLVDGEEPESVVEVESAITTNPHA